MKIAHVMSGASYGGTQGQYERLVQALHGAGVGQRLIVAPHPGNAKLRAAGIDVVEMDLPGRIGFMTRRRIDGELGRFTPDIVMSWLPEVTALVDRGSYVHVARVATPFKPEIYQTCAAILSPSQVRADAAREGGWPADKIKVLPNLPAAALPQRPVEPFDRKKLFTPATARIVFTAARLEKRKGIDLLIDAIGQMTSTYLWIAGEGEDRAFFEQHALARGLKPRVRFLGWQDDLRPYFAAADLFVYPARQEDLADPIVEAWSAGLPVIAADTLGPGLLISDRENGLLVPVNNATALAEAIRALLADRETAQRLAESGYKAFEAEFAGKAVLQKYLDYFASLTGTPAATPTSPAAG